MSMRILAIDGSVMMHEPGFALADGDGVECCCKEPPKEPCIGGVPSATDCLVECNSRYDLSASGLIYGGNTGQGCPVEIPPFQIRLDRHGLINFCSYRLIANHFLIDDDECLMFVRGADFGWTAIRPCGDPNAVYWSISIIVAGIPGWLNGDYLQHYRRDGTLDEDGFCCPPRGIYEPFDPLDFPSCPNFPADTGANANVGDPGVVEIL